MGIRQRRWTRGGNLLRQWFLDRGIPRADWSAVMGYDIPNRISNNVDGWGAPTAASRMRIHAVTGIPMESWDQPGVQTHEVMTRGDVRQPPRGPGQTRVEEAPPVVVEEPPAYGRERTSWDREAILADVRGRLARMMFAPETPPEIVERVALAFRAAPEHEVLRVFIKLWDRRHSEAA